VVLQKGQGLQVGKELLSVDCEEDNADVNDVMKLEFTDALLLGNRVPEKDVPSLNVTDMLLEFGNTVADREAPL